MCQRPSANYERFPGNLKRVKWSNLVRKARGCRVALSAYFGQAPFSPEKKKERKNATCRDWCAQSLVHQSCSCNNVVEQVGKTSLALNTVFGHDLGKE